MVIINVIKSFVLNLGGLLRKFEAGVHEVEDEIASHWYVQAHTQAEATPATPDETPAPDTADETAKKGK